MTITLEAEPSRLWREAVRRVRRRRGGRTSRNHQTGAAENGRVVLHLLLLLFLGLACLVVCLEGRQLLGLLAQEVDHVRHGEVVEAVAPRQLQDHIRADQVVAGVQHAHVALAVADIDELNGQQ
jgi:hypothetical protein